MHIPRSPGSILTLTVCAGLFVSFVTPFQRTVSSQAQRKGTPRPGKPEGQLKSLAEIKHQQNVRRERSTPVPSTIRSSKMPLQPWDGKRVGDPFPGDRQKEPAEVRRAHAKRSAPFVVLDDTFIHNFYLYVMTASYTPLTGEKPYWRDQLRVGYAKHRTALNLAAIEMGKTLLESTWYLNRNRTNSNLFQCCRTSDLIEFKQGFRLDYYDLKID